MNETENRSWQDFAGQLQRALGVLPAKSWRDHLLLCFNFVLHVFALFQDHRIGTHRFYVCFETCFTQGRYTPARTPIKPIGSETVFLKHCKKHKKWKKTILAGLCRTSLGAHPARTRQSLARIGFADVVLCFLQCFRTTGSGPIIFIGFLAGVQRPCVKHFSKKR